LRCAIGLPRRTDHYFFFGRYVRWRIAHAAAKQYLFHKQIETSSLGTRCVDRCDGHPTMLTPEEYRERARRCRSMAAEACSEQYRDIFLELAQIWERAALRVEALARWPLPDEPSQNAKKAPRSP
jgi:hypothetical protein